MAVCELIEKCPFFNGKLADKPVEVDALKDKYCKTNNLNCARYMVANSIGREKMPPDLYPHEKETAYMVIAQG